MKYILEIGFWKTVEEEERLNEWPDKENQTTTAVFAEFQFHHNQCFFLSTLCSEACQLL
jgi:hypothetical protein